jgi:hypothetical protein
MFGERLVALPQVLLLVSVLQLLPATLWLALQRSSRCCCCCCLLLLLLLLLLFAV